ncbi:Cytochrome p450 [Thalictrum thalictroides]|uniref:Cytochrome p450 n=1 Tax=Thalictrum thalictroides TaxID=46969 RepID=A0A7J6VXE2_THATH|nr:Cytochrome p450 [Thalictrum thalictroides]
MDSTIYISIFFILFISFKYILTRKKLPPSPFALPILGHLHLLKKPLHRTFQSLSHQFGPILYLKFGFRNVLIISSPSFVEEIFTKNDIIFANRPDFLAGQYLGQNYTHIGWAPYGNQWRNLRRVTSIEIFSSNRILLSSNLRRQEIIHSIKEMFLQSSNEWKFIDLKSTFFDLTLNIMMKIVAGRPFYEHGIDLENKKRMREFLKDTFVPNVSMNLGDCFKILRRIPFLGLEKNLVKISRTRTEFLQSLIDERRRKRSSGGELIDEDNKRITLIDGLLSLQETELDYYTDDTIQGLIMIMYTAGTDTSALTMEWAMSVLLNHPEVLDKARAEIDSNVEEGRLMDDSDLPKLPYLHCIINETLRLFPAGPLLVPRSTSEECIIGGYKIPRGTILFVNAWAIHRDPKAWEEPDSFKPERFEGVQGERDGFKFIPFGVGRRGCPGAGLAMKTMALVLGIFIQCFEWKRVGPELVDLTSGSGQTMPKAIPLEAFYRPRHGNSFTTLMSANSY